MRDLQAAVKKTARRSESLTTATPTGSARSMNTGEIVWGDELMVVFSRSILAEQPGAAIIGDVKCSQAHVRRHRDARRAADHVEDRPFADQEQAQGGARGARRRDERPHVLQRPLLRLRRCDLRVVPAAGNSRPRRQGAWRDAGGFAADLLHARSFASIVPTTASSRSCARPPNISARITTPSISTARG